MTVEDRAHNVFFSIDHMVDVINRVTITEAIAKALRDQIEDCAKIGDEQAAFHRCEANRLSRNEDAANCEKTGEHASERIAARIRALAGEKEGEI